MEKNLHPSPMTDGDENAPTGLRTYTTTSLFGDQNEIVVLHNGAAYRLRITRQDKLILTK